jgi:glucosyl-3-phosphoglycerate synthase
MGDFYQNSIITTLHNFRNRSVDDVEQELVKLKATRPMGLIIPSLYSEIGSPALQKIVEVLKKVEYLNEVVIGLDGADASEFAHAKEYFKTLPQTVRVLWNDGPGIKRIAYKLNDHNIHTGNPGKGKNVWFCFGYMIASARSEAIALHHADISTYDRELLARLIYPVAKPTFNYKFCKGYYYRCDEEKINGRLVRLLVTPLIKTLKKIYGPNDYLDFIDGFRYILSGELSMRADVMKTIKVYGDWGFDLGILAEVHRNNTLSRICQVDIADRYDHRHLSDSFDNPDKGLSKMSLDITKNIYSKLASDGVLFTEGGFRTIKATYHRIAVDMIDQFHNDAIMNGLTSDRYKEERLVDQFARNVFQSGINFLNNPNHAQVMPSWKRVLSVLPDIGAEFYNAVEADNA